MANGGLPAEAVGRPVERQRAIAALVVVGLLVAVAAVIWRLPAGNAPAPAPTPAVSTPAPTLGLDRGEVPLLLLEPLTETEARAVNAAIPIAALPNPAATPFYLPRTDPIAYGRALDCLTAAIYYEAGFESAQGRAAVAQVVLNRLRHPLYPKSVCAVVFQGSERTTGCQFSFTCDGAMARLPNARIYEDARQIAAAALAGHVEPLPGWSTHYHTDWVVPYWAKSLAKTTLIGAHIFYRLPARFGSGAAFTGGHVGAEPEIAQMARLSTVEPDAPVPLDPARLLATGIAEAPVLNPAGATPGDLAPLMAPPALSAGEPQAPQPTATATPAPKKAGEGYYPPLREPRRGRLPM